MFSDILGLSDILRTFNANRNVLGHSQTFGHFPDFYKTPHSELVRALISNPSLIKMRYIVCYKYKTDFEYITIEHG
jgi:hypothetical protein